MDLVIFQVVALIIFLPIQAYEYLELVSQGIFRICIMSLLFIKQLKDSKCCCFDVHGSF